MSVRESLPEAPESVAPDTGGLLLQLRPDRRLGHEWDDWDGAPLPNGGAFTSYEGLFFVTAALAGGSVVGATSGVVWLAAPRLAALSPAVPAVLMYATLGAGLLWLFWLFALALSLRTRAGWLPRRLGEAGLLPWVMPKLEGFARAVGLSRDRLGNSMLRVFNRLAASRIRGAVAPEEMLILLPRCLGKEAMQKAMRVSTVYSVPLFVAARGRYARQMIALKRPKAIVAVACERDLVSGVHDVAGKLPVMSTTLHLPDGPCRNTEFSVDELELRVRQTLGLDGAETKNPAF